MSDRFLASLNADLHPVAIFRFSLFGSSFFATRSNVQNGATNPDGTPKGSDSEKKIEWRYQARCNSIRSDFSRLCDRPSLRLIPLKNKFKKTVISSKHRLRRRSALRSCRGLNPPPKSIYMQDARAQFDKQDASDR